MKKLILILTTCFFAASCTKEIELDLPDYPSKLVINGEFDSETDMTLSISRSLPVLYKTDSTGYLIKDATVKIFEDGTYIGDAVYVGGKYTLNKKPSAGKSYSVEARSTLYSKAIAKLTMPKQLNITATYIDSVGLDADGFKVGQVKLVFTDDAQVSNYYKMLIRWYNSSTLTWYPLNIKSNDIVFLNNDKLNDGSYLFSDRTFSGKTKVLTFETTSSMGRGTPKFEISLKSFNDDYYNYLIQTDDYSQSGNGVSAEPVIIRSNVTNGLGMVGGVVNAKDTIF